MSSYMSSPMDGLGAAFQSIFGSRRHSWRMSRRYWCTSKYRSRRDIDASRTMLPTVATMSRGHVAQYWFGTSKKGVFQGLRPVDLLVAVAGPAHGDATLREDTR